MNTIIPMLLALWLFLFGAILGSFLNVVVFRIPRQNFFEKARSYCPQCEHSLAARDLVPVLSYLVLRGRCRYCGCGISARYPAVEVFCGLLALLCVWRYGFDPRAPFTFVLFLVLLALSLIDFDTLEIPDLFHIVLLPFALSSLWLWPEISLGERLLGILSVSLLLLLITLAVANAFGGGDIKLMAVCGFLLGWKLALLSLFLALCFGGSFAVYLLLRRKTEKGRHIAFGPWLCLGIALSLVWGQEILGYYLALFP